MTLLMNLEDHSKPNPISGNCKKRNVEAELNEIETDKTTQRISKPKNLFLEMVNMIDRPLAKLTKRKITKMNRRKKPYNIHQKNPHYYKGKLWNPILYQNGKSK